MKRIALITGVTGRLGKDFCNRYGEDYTIVGVSRTGEKPIGCSLMLNFNICKDYELIVNKVLKEFGKIDLLINNAATYHIKPLELHTPEEMAEVFQVNVIAPYSLIRSAYFNFWKYRPIRNLKFQRHVINVGSVSAFHSYEGQIAYGASKAALNHLNLHLQTELKKCNIKSSIIHPTSFPSIVSTQLVTDVLVKIDKNSATKEDLLLIQGKKNEEISTT